MANKITVIELKSQKNDFVIIDVREIDELEGGKIRDSIHMPLGLTIRNATYCGTGYRGNIAADELLKEGFDAVTLDGGYNSWNSS